MRLGLGMGLQRGKKKRSGSAPTRIDLSNLSIAEDQALNTNFATISTVNKPGDWGTSTYAITVDADNKFATLGTGLRIDNAVNYEVATSHQVTIRDTPSGPYSPITRVFTIAITNVLEVTLSALTLNTSTIQEGSAPATVVGALQSVSSGSSLSLTDDAGGRFALSGSNIVAGLVATDFDVATSHNITVRETHADGSNSPRDSVIAITVTEEVDAPGELTSATWASNAGDDEPDFDFNLPVNVQEGDDLVAEKSIANAATWSNYFTHTLTAQDIIDDEITINGIDSLADNTTYDFRFRLERAGTPGPWTQVDDVVINLAPTVSTLNPTDNATGVAITFSPVITFNKNVQFGTGNITIKKTSDDSTIEAFNVATEQGTGNGQVSISGAALTINPTASLAGTTEYYILIDLTAVENLDEIPFAGIAATTTWSFTTAAAGFTEQWVTFDGTNDRLAKSSNLSTDSKTALIFISADFATVHGGTIRRLLDQSTGASYVAREASGLVEVVWRDTAASAVILMFGGTAIGAERANILVALDADATSRIWVWREGAGAWSAQGTDAAGGGANLEFTTGTAGIASRDDGFTQPFDGNLSRVAIWTGISVPDITNSAVRDNFCNSTTGVLVDPATSVAAYGTPVVDFYGNAAAWNNVSANHGSSTGWSMVGSVVDA